MMISVIIPTLNAAETLNATLSVLAPAKSGGLILDVIVVDGGSTDATLAIAGKGNCIRIASSSGRGQQMARGAKAAKGRWLLFLHADTILEDGWINEVCEHMEVQPEKAAVFRFAMQSDRVQARIIEWIVNWRCRLLALPYGDQGLLIEKEYYDRLGGFASLPLMEDVEIIRRIGRRRLHFLETRAISSAARYDKGGYFIRPIRNLFCLGLYFIGVPVATIKRIYG